MLADIVALRSGDFDAAIVDMRAVAEITEYEEARRKVALDIPTPTDQQCVEACAVAALAGATVVANTADYGD
ncbi:MAG: hypothetical protein OXN89_07175 [Bryobacterales bacterium]|nr:hypothetical protein [Bryobacterales bacterium]